MDWKVHVILILEHRHLPNEILATSLGYCSLISIINFEYVCSRLFYISNNEKRYLKYKKTSAWYNCFFFLVWLSSNNFWFVTRRHSTWKFYLFTSEKKKLNKIMFKIKHFHVFYHMFYCISVSRAAKIGIRIVYNFLLRKKVL